MPNMQEVMRMIESRKSHLTQHPFFTWIQDDKVPLEEKLYFAPIMTVFVMNFRDMNKWFIRFESEMDSLREIVNGNTEEDETHSALFLEDWKRLDLDQRLGWRASDTLWWLFLADETEAFRAYGVDFARMTILDHDDVLVRFAHSEAGEACGNVFFSYVAPLAARISGKTGIDYCYFGHYHLDREQGHVIASEGIFENKELTREQADLSLRLAENMFHIFEGMHTHFLNYAQKYVAERLTPQRPAKIRVPEIEEGLPPATTRPSNPSSGFHADVQRALDARRLRTAQHPFYTWLRAANGLSPLEKLQRFIPMWVMDIMGYRDLNRYALRIASPATEDERAFNRWIDSLETHSAIFMRDWDALGMDETLDWLASDTLQFLFLDPGTDVHRRNIAQFIKLALRHEKPILRFWLLEALEASGEAFFYHTRALALAVEENYGCRLDYLADRHDAGEDTQLGRWSYLFKDQATSPHDRDVALSMIGTVFDAVDEQLSLSLEVARGNRFGIGLKKNSIIEVKSLALSPTNASAELRL